MTSASKTANGRETLTLALKARLQTRVVVQFTPKNGKQRKILHKTLTVTIP